MLCSFINAVIDIETSVFSYLAAQPSNDLRAMANQSATSDWWETQRPNYSVFVSELVISEASKGHPEAARRRLAIIADLPLLQNFSRSSEFGAGTHPKSCTAAES
jgi:hypothetical protein